MDRNNKRSATRLVTNFLLASLLMVLAVSIHQSGRAANLAWGEGIQEQKHGHRFRLLLVNQLLAPASAETNLREVEAGSANSGSYLQSTSDPSKRIDYQPQAQTQTRNEKLKIYNTLRETCRQWTRWYKQDASVNAAANMNEACRQAAEYGRDELNINTKTPKHVDLNSLEQPRAPSSGRAVLLNSNGSPQVSTSCQSVQKRLDSVQAQLRSPHSAKRGQRLRERRRELWDLEREHCR